MHESVNVVHLRLADNSHALKEVDDILIIWQRTRLFRCITIKCGNII